MDPVSVALGDHDRRRILARLGHGPATAADLSDELSLDGEVLATHLEVLDGAGLVENDPMVAGAHRTAIRLRTDTFSGIDQLLSAYEELWRSRADALHVEVARNEARTDGKGSP